MKRSNKRVEADLATISLEGIEPSRIVKACDNLYASLSSRIFNVHKIQARILMLELDGIESLFRIVQEGSDEISVRAAVRVLSYLTNDVESAIKLHQMGILQLVEKLNKEHSADDYITKDIGKIRR